MFKFGLNWSATYAYNTRAMLRRAQREVELKLIKEDIEALQRQEQNSRNCVIALVLYYLLDDLWEEAEDDDDLDEESEALIIMALAMVTNAAQKRAVTTSLRHDKADIIKSRPPRTTAESFQTETRRNRRRRRAHTHDEARRDRNIAASTDADANVLNVLTRLRDTYSSFTRQRIELYTQKHEDLMRIRQEEFERRKRQAEEELELRKRQAERDTKSAEFRDKLQEIADGAFMNYLSGVENDREKLDLILNYMKYR